MKNPSFPVPTRYAIHCRSERYFRSSLNFNRRLSYYNGHPEKQTSGGVGSRLPRENLRESLLWIEGEIPEYRSNYLSAELEGKRGILFRYHL